MDNLERKAKCMLLKQLMEEMGSDLVGKLVPSEGVEVVKVEEDPEKGELEIKSQSVEVSEADDVKEALKGLKKPEDVEEDEDEKDESFLDQLPVRLKEALLKKFKGK